MITWYEAFIDTGKDGTMTVASFNTLEEGLEYVKSNPLDDPTLKLDKWQAANEDATPENVALIPTN